MTGIIWARESNQHDKNEYSIKSQVDACKARAAQDGIPVGHTFIEKFSGRDLHKMPRLTEMRRLLERADGPKVIYAYAQDRLVRGEDAYDIFFLLVEFRRHNAEVRFILNPVDLSNIAGQIQMLIAGHEASGEIAKILDRTQRGKVKRMQEGKVYGSGTEKYGYIRDKAAGTVSLNETEAAVLRRAARLILDNGLSLSQVCRRLNAEGIPSPATARGLRQGVWSNASLGRLLKDPAYKGEGYGHRYAKSKDGKSVNLANRSNWIPLPIYPAIFSADDWSRLQVAIREKRQEQRRNERYPALLRGHVFCGHCGRRMVYQIDRRNKKKVRTFYECKNQTVRARHGERPPRCPTPTLRAEYLDALVWSAVCRLLDAPAVAERAIQNRAVSPDIERWQDERQMLTDELTTKERQQSNLLGQLADTPPAVAHLLQGKLADIEAQKAEIASRLDYLERQVATYRTPATDSQLLAEIVSRYHKRRDEPLRFADRRQVLEHLKVQVLSHKGQVIVSANLIGLILQQVSADLLRKYGVNWTK